MNGKEEQIQSKARELLPRLDLQQSTLNSIQESLESELGFSLEEYKAVLRSEVNTFLREKAASEQALQNKRKATECNNEVAKKSKETSKVPGFYQLSAKRFVGLKTYQGKHLVDIREFYEKDGQMMPGRAGISLTVKQWESLCDLMKPDGEINGLLRTIQDGPGSLKSNDHSFEISPKRKVSIVFLGDSAGVDIREFYDSNGEMKPSKKGICLPQDQYDTLRLVMGPLSEEVARLDDPNAPGEENEEKTKDNVTNNTNNGPKDEGPTALPQPQQQQQQEAPAGPTKHALSQNRYVSLENWRGSDLINLREYYEKDGELRPGKKGISLTASQAKVILEKIDEISEAFARQDESFSLEISPKRKVSISMFKGTPMVNVREYYEKNGALCPGAKGLSMPEEQWKALKAVFPNLVQSMK